MVVVVGGKSDVFALPAARLHGRSRARVGCLGHGSGAGKRDLRHRAMTSLPMYLCTYVPKQGWEEHWCKSSHNISLSQVNGIITGVS